jgi:hypothetical protein
MPAMYLLKNVLFGLDGGQGGATERSRRTRKERTEVVIALDRIGTTTHIPKSGDKHVFIQAEIHATQSIINTSFSTINANIFFLILNLEPWILYRKSVWACCRIIENLTLASYLEN